MRSLSKLIKNVPKTYAFVSTDGEACSATVTAVVTQVYSKENTTNVGYSSGNGYYLMQGYMVGNSDYMVTPWYGNSVKLKLGNK